VLASAPAGPLWWCGRLLSVEPPDLERLVDRVATMADASRDGRRVIGITGAPGAGKTTLVLALLAAAAAEPRLGGRIAHIPMDGFHLTNGELERLGLRDRKGAPETFDAQAYAAMLRAVRAMPRAVLTAPAFDHAIGEPEPAAIGIPLAADVVVTEGNYLLLDDAAWLPVRYQLDEVWFCALDDRVRRDRLISRHVETGRDLDDATAWVDRSDEVNARRVSHTVAGADLVVVDGRIVAG
jgi:pantothenate kinase